MIGVKDLQYRIGTFFLDVSLVDIKEGEFHVLLGPTGSGKTLLLEYMAGLLPKAAGSMLIRDKKAEKLSPEARHISYVTQDLALFPHLTVKENIEFGLRFRRTNGFSILDKLVEATGIGQLLSRYPANLSGGEKQRVAIVRALATQPSVLLLDEPFSALHPSLKLTLWQLIKKLHKELGLTVMMVSHDVEEALALGDVISFISGGAIKQTAKRKEIYYRPKTLEVAKFFGFHNVFQGVVKSLDDENLGLLAESFGFIKVAPTHREAEIKKGQKVWWGIHAEEVTVVKPDRRDIPRQNLFSGMVANLVEIGRTCIVSVLLNKVAGTEQGVLEINLPDYTSRKLEIRQGQQLDLELKPSSIFVMQE